jgi:hypothetical protein
VRGAQPGAARSRHRCLRRDRSRARGHQVSDWCVEITGRDVLGRGSRPGRKGAHPWDAPALAVHGSRRPVRDPQPNASPPDATLTTCAIGTTRDRRKVPVESQRHQPWLQRGPAVCAVPRSGAGRREPRMASAGAPQGRVHGRPAIDRGTAQTVTVAPTASKGQDKVGSNA